MLVVAHASHWINLVFFVPVVAFICWLAVTQFRERRAAARGANAGPERDR